MRQVTFGEHKSYDDLHIIIGSKEIGMPSVKTATIDVEGADGVIDQTEYFGRVNYGNRTIKYECSLMVYPLLEYYTALADVLHGRRFKIVHDDDPDWFYVGRLALSEFREEKGVGKFTIEADCEPYKLYHTQTLHTEVVDGSASIVLNNSRKRAIPTIQTNAEMTIVYNGLTLVHSAGTYLHPDIELVEGNNVIDVTGTGTITFTWQEGRL